MNYIITGGTGFIGTNLTNLIKERYPNAQVYNLDIVKPGTPNPVVKDYKPALRDGQKLQSTFIEYDIRKPIENLPFTPTEDDVIFNFAAVHRNPGHEDHKYFETNIRGAENVVAFAEKCQNGDAAHRQLTIVRSCVVFSKSPLARMAVPI